MHPMRTVQSIRPENDITHFVFTALAIIFWVAVIYGILTLLNRYMRRSDAGLKAVQDPLELAKTRYAKGEINREEFIQLKKDLS